MTELFNLSEQTPMRQLLRSQDIACEKIIWTRLKGKQLGYKFRRQFGVGNYIIDFYCPSLMLGIEIDGATHSTDEEVYYDKDRQDFLETAGIVIKRYTNDNVRKNLNEVIEDIICICKQLEVQTRPHRPTATSPSQGEVNLLPLAKGERSRKAERG